MKSWLSSAREDHGLCYVLDVGSASWTGARHLLTSVISA